MVELCKEIPSLVMTLIQPNFPAQFEIKSLSASVLLNNNFITPLLPGMTYPNKIITIVRYSPRGVPSWPFLFPQKEFASSLLNLLVNNGHFVARSHSATSGFPQFVMKRLPLVKHHRKHSFWPAEVFSLVSSANCCFEVQGYGRTCAPMLLFIISCFILRFNCQMSIETCKAPSKKHVHLPNIISNTGSFMIFMAKVIDCFKSNLMWCIFFPRLLCSY